MTLRHPWQLPRTGPTSQPGPLCIRRAGGGRVALPVRAGPAGLGLDDGGCPWRSDPDCPLELLARGTEQDLVDVQLFRLADRKGNDPREGLGRNSDLSYVVPICL